MAHFAKILWRKLTPSIAGGVVKEKKYYDFK
jgi:hypothetical protein